MVVCAYNASAVLNVTASIVVCFSPSIFNLSTAPPSYAYGCTENETCKSTVWANCTIQGPGNYTLGETPCGWEPTVELNYSATMYDLSVVSNANVHAVVYGGSFEGNASMLWAHDGADVSLATVEGYFGGYNVTTVPESCDYLACIPLSNTTAAPCEPIVPDAEICTGDETFCVPTESGGSLCIDTDCDYVPDAPTIGAGIFAFPPGCRPFTICEHITVPAIFPDDNACLCNTGFDLDPDGASCRVSNFSTGIICDTEQYAARTNSSFFECLNLTTCSGQVLLEATETSDRICAAEPTVCLGELSLGGICTTPTPTCTSVQYILPDTVHTPTPTCITLSPPCNKHSIETVAPTPTSDRVCTRYTKINTIGAIALGIAPSLIYSGIWLYYSLK